jgi:large subunit ribosomal protein L6
MSRIGNMPIEIPSGVKVDISGTHVTVKGSNGELTLDLHPSVSAEVKDARVVLTRGDDEKQSRSFHGLDRSLVANMVQGVAEGFSKDLEVQGVGFRGEVKGKALSMSLGFSGPKMVDIPDGITVNVDGGTNISIKGADKQKVGELAARVRSLYPAEPYKGKGVRYKGEYVRRKAGKTVA